MDLQIEDETGQTFLQDEGGFEREGDELAFQSARFGDRFLAPTLL